MKQFLEGFQLLNRVELLEVNGGYSSSAYGGSGVITGDKVPEITGFQVPLLT